MSEYPAMFPIVIWLCSPCWPDPSTTAWRSDLVSPLQLPGPEMWLSLRLIIVFWPGLWQAGIPSCQRPSVGLQPSMSGSCCHAPWRVELPSLWLWPLVPYFDSPSHCWHRFIWPNLIWSSLRRCDTWRLFSSSRAVPIRLGPGTLFGVVCCKAERIAVNIPLMSRSQKNQACGGDGTTQICNSDYTSWRTPDSFILWINNYWMHSIPANYHKTAASTVFCRFWLHVRMKFPLKLHTQLQERLIQAVNFFLYKGHL